MVGLDLAGGAAGGGARAAGTDAGGNRALLARPFLRRLSGHRHDRRPCGRSGRRGCGSTRACRPVSADWSSTSVRSGPAPASCCAPRARVPSPSPLVLLSDEVSIERRRRRRAGARRRDRPPPLPLVDGRSASAATSSPWSRDPERVERRRERVEQLPPGSLPRGSRAAHAASQSEPLVAAGGLGDPVGVEQHELSGSHGNRLLAPHRVLECAQQGSRRRSFGHAAAGGRPRSAGGWPAELSTSSSRAEPCAQGGAQRLTDSRRNSSSSRCRIAAGWGSRRLAKRAP